MKQEKRRIFKMYSAWNYEGETEQLNRLSKQGWQLASGGSFCSHFVKNDRVQYIYQLDYQPRLSELGRYLETYQEQGWEFINKTFNGWYYFRKLYDPAVPAEEYEIYTDRDSLKAMNKRWANTALIFTIFLGILLINTGIFNFNAPTLYSTAELIAIGVEFITFLRGVLIMRDPVKAKKDRHDGLRLAILFLTLIVGLSVSLTLRFARPVTWSQMRAEYYSPIAADLENGILWNTLEVKYTDNYYLDLRMQADSEITFSIVDADRKTIFTKTAESIDLSNVKLRLVPGEYLILLSDYAGGGIDLEYHLK